MDTVREVTGIDFTWTSSAGGPETRRPTSPTPTKIGKELGWSARLDLSDMVRSAWEAWQSAQSAR